jgi:competence protein ComEC
MKGTASPAVKTDTGISQGFHAVEAKYLASGSPVPLGEIRLFPDEELKCGRTYTLCVKILPENKRRNPGAPEGSRPAGKVIKVVSEGRAPFFERIRARINGFYISRFSPSEAGFLMAVTTGETAYIDQGMRDSFARSGLVHILVIAGLHFSIFAMVVFSLIRFSFKLFCLKALERMALYISPAQLSALLAIPFLAAYYFISGQHTPALRSFIMIGMFLLGTVLGRRNAGFNSLLIAAAAIVLWRPEAILEVSFQMSFLSVFFIGLFAVRGPKEPEAETQPGGKQSFKRRYLRKSVLVSISATLGTLPACIYYFHRFSTISPVSNLVAVPIMGGVLTPLAVLCSFIYALTGVYVLPELSGRLAGLSIGMADTFASVPYSSLNIPAIPAGVTLLTYAGFVPYILKRRAAYLVPAAVPLLLWVVLSFPGRPPLKITQLDVGHGDSAVIELPDGKTLVLDTGKTGREAAYYLKYRGISTIDALILSHAHNDHTGGLENLLGHFRVKEVWDNGRLEYSKELKLPLIKHLQRGDYTEGPGYKITALHPFKAFYSSSGRAYVSENDDSLVLKLEGTRGGSMLFMGDASQEAEEEIAGLGSTLKSDVIKVPHHGSAGAVCPDLLEAVSPSAAVISTDAKNPHEEAMEALSGSRVLRTDRDGAVGIELGKGGPRIETFRERELRITPSSPADELHNLRMLFSSW